MTTVNGVLQLDRNGGYLRQVKASFAARPNDPFVPAGLIEKHHLVSGASVTGPAERGKRGLTLTDVELICEMHPGDFAERTPFEQLTVIDPTDRFHLADCGLMTMRVMDLVAPIGKGTRGLVVSPPKAGKTTILRDFVKAVRADDPDLRIVVLLIDERPEEVTEFRRQVQAEVLASSLDQVATEHTALAELVLDHVRCELECGRDVVVVIDSLTRMARAFNVGGGRNGGRNSRDQGRRGRRDRGGASGSGRGGHGILSGGMGVGAMEIPRRIFGLARNVEGGGSVTVLASILVDTGSRMDQVIFEEFKGTGNSELILDQKLSELRIFPAIDVPASGTRREEKLLGEKELKACQGIRRTLANANTVDATRMLINRLQKFPTNADFFAQISL